MEKVKSSGAIQPKGDGNVEAKYPYTLEWLYENVHSTVQSNLLGKVLTLIDATYLNEIQNKAVKDMIKGIFWEGDTRIARDFKDHEFYVSGKRSLATVVTNY